MTVSMDRTETISPYKRLRQPTLFRLPPPPHPVRRPPPAGSSAARRRSRPMGRLVPARRRRGHRGVFRLSLVHLPSASNSITDDAFVEAHIVNVTPEMVSGRIVRFLVEENDHVEQGQVLAEIEPVHYRDQVEQAQGKLELAEAELKRQEAGLAKLKNEVPLQIDVAEKSVEEGACSRHRCQGESHARQAGI